MNRLENRPPNRSKTHRILAAEHGDVNFGRLDAQSEYEERPGMRFGPTFMRKPLSRPEQDEHGTSQTSIRHHPRGAERHKSYAVAPIHTGGVALRYVGPGDPT